MIHQLSSRNIRGYGLLTQKDDKGRLNYYLHNAHGDVTSLIDASGKVLNSYQYDAFGNTMTYAETVANRFLYAGEQLDPITGQYYLRARYYDPTVGRFTQEDTYRGDGLNLYAYVGNNPVKYVDPSGLCKDEIIAAVDEHILYNPNISEAAKKQLRKIIGKGTGNGGTTIGPAPYTGPTISSGTLDPITQAAIKKAQALLDKMLDKYYPYEWPEGYSIGDYTLSAEYMTRYKNEVDRANSVASFFNTLDLADDIKKTYEELSGTGVSNPYTLAVSSVLIGAWRNQADKEPGIAELPDALGISGWLTKNIAKAKEKSDFIDGSNYRYLVYSGQFLWEEGPKGKFIDNITTLQNEISKKSYSIYGTSAENNAYKQALTGYLGTIKNMNVNYDQSVSGMNFFLNRIDDKYK